MRNPPVLEQIPSLGDFEGIINARRKKDFGYGALAVGRNVEVTDTKKLVRRNGYAGVDTGIYAGLYGSLSQKQLLAVRSGELLLYDSALEASVLQTGVLGTDFAWDEDPANNIYYTSDGGSNGIVAGTNWLPLALAVPTIESAAAIDTAAWRVTPLNLGKKYNATVMQLFATYLYPDGRESAPSEIATVAIAPEVKLLQVAVPVQSGCTTRVYATAPGGSTYYLVAVTDKPVFTIPVYMLLQQLTGTDYPYTTVLSSFPATASILGFYAGRLWAGVYDPITDLGAVYGSLPLQYHLFDMKSDVFQVAGPPNLFLTCKDGLVVGTDRAIYIYKEPSDDKQHKSSLDVLAPYGVPPGNAGDVGMDGTAWFWTLRGVAKAMPYALVTEHRFYGDPGVVNYAKVFYERGYAKLVASTIAGNPVFNEWKEKR